VLPTIVRQILSEIPHTVEFLPEILSVTSKTFAPKLVSCVPGSGADTGSQGRPLIMLRQILLSGWRPPSFRSARLLCTDASFRLLGLRPNASEAEVKDAFKVAAKKWHPDLHQGHSKVHAEEEFKRALNAYNLLTGRGSDSGREAPDAGGPRSARSRARGSTNNGYWGSYARYGEASRPGALVI
jgi:hypothetical protein